MLLMGIFFFTRAFLPDVLVLGIHGTEHAKGCGGRLRGPLCYCDDSSACQSAGAHAGETDGVAREEEAEEQESVR